MATGGTQYTEKVDLCNAIIAKVFNNNTFEVSPADIQLAALDIVESLWPKACPIEEFSETSTYMNVTGQRWTYGNEISIVMNVNFLDNDQGAGVWAADSVSVLNVIPLNFEGYTWFKPENVTAIVNDVTGGGGSFGFVEMNDISSYTSGVATPGDITRLFMPGSVKGSLRTYVSDEVDDNAATYDISEGPVTPPNNYISNSPKDITVSPLNITFRNMADALAAANQPNYVGNMTFYMKGVLL